MFDKNKHKKGIKSLFLFSDFGWLCVCVYIHIHIFTHIHIHIYTHPHTQIHSYVYILFWNVNAFHNRRLGSSRTCSRSLENKVIQSVILENYHWKEIMNDVTNIHMVTNSNRAKWAENPPPSNPNFWVWNSLECSKSHIPAGLFCLASHPQPGLSAPLIPFQVLSVWYQLDSKKKLFSKHLLHIWYIFLKLLLKDYTKNYLAREVLIYLRGFLFYEFNDCLPKGKI